MKYELTFNGEVKGAFPNLADTLDKTWAVWMTETGSWLGDYEEGFYLKMTNNRGDVLEVKSFV